MNALRINIRLRTFLCGFLLAVLLFGCGGSVDDREQIRAAYGEPDEMLQGGGGPYWFEVWYYNEKGFGTEFRRSAPKCGGGYDFYLSRTFDYDPATRRNGEIEIPEAASVGASKRSLVGP
ncbi:MAG: hypothetical protein KAR36_14005 [Candidatus Latescibacteria bacterium]|nr:hypothetical protein [Candidatus Latescibacterota bacterium]